MSAAAIKNRCGKYIAKIGSDSEPLGGRLQPSRRAERDFCEREETMEWLSNGL